MTRGVVPVFASWDAVLGAAACVPGLHDVGRDGRPRRVLLPRCAGVAVMTVPGVVARVRRHGYFWSDDDEVVVDVVHLWAERPAVRALGLLLACVALDGRAAVPLELRLEDAATHVPTLRMWPPADSSSPRGEGLRYRPRSRARCPLRRRPSAGDDDWPALEVVRRGTPPSAVSDSLPISMQAPGGIEAVDLHGNVRGLAALARLFLDAGDPAQPEAEFVLEGEWGFGGVAAGSAELTVWLPGSINWPAPGIEQA